MICDPTLDLPMPCTFPPHPTQPYPSTMSGNFFHLHCIDQGQANPFLAHDGRGRVSRHANFKRPPLTGWGPLSRLITTLAHCSTHKTCITGCAKGGAEQVLQFLCGLELCQTFATSRAEQSIAVQLCIARQCNLVSAWLCIALNHLMSQSIVHFCEVHCNGLNHTPWQ